MSKSTSKNKAEPYYRKFGKPVWYRNALGFPKGRDPYHDLFNDEFISELVEKISVKYKPDQKVLQADLRDLAHDYLTAAYSAPFGIGDGPASLTRDERIRFLESDVINPARKLLNSLSDKEAHQFFEWPEDRIGEDPDKAILVRQLTRILYRANNILDSVIDRQNDGSDVLSEFKIEVASGLEMVFVDHYPELPAQISPHDRASAPHSEFFIFLRRCSDQIFKGDLVLSVGLIDSATRPRRKR